MSAPVDFTDLRRVHHDTGSDIDPLHDPSWDEMTSLRWHAAVVSHDCDGLPITVRAGGARMLRRGKWVDEPGTYSLTVGSSSCSAFRYDSAVTYLNGVATGWRSAHAGERP